MSKRNKKFAFFGVTEDRRAVTLTGPDGTYELRTLRRGASNDINRVFGCMALVMSDSDWEVVRVGLAQHDAERGKR